MSYQSEYQIGGSFAVLFGLALPIFFVDQSTRLVLTGVLGIFAFLFSFFFKEVAISVAFAITGIVIAVTSISEYSKSKDLLDLGVAGLGFLVFMCVAIAEALIHAQEKRLPLFFQEEFFSDRSGKQAAIERFFKQKDPGPIFENPAEVARSRSFDVEI